MRSLSKHLRRVFFPHGAVFVLLLPLSLALLLYSLGNGQAERWVQYPSYLLSAYALTALCCKLPSLLRFWKRVKRENKVLAAYNSSPRLRMNISLYAALILNGLYAVFQFCLGLRQGLLWYYTMAAYYLIMAIMRYSLLLYSIDHRPGENRREELRRYRFCALVLLGMNLVLGVMVFYITWKKPAFSQNEIACIAMAAYTFTAFIQAFINMIRYRRYKSPVFSAAKVIGFTAAMVSMLTLETAMLAAFGQNEDGFAQFMTGLTGGAVVLTVLLLAVHMLVKAAKELKYTGNKEK